jgi:putative addiction module component (TIGR02574 family)
MIPPMSLPPLATKDQIVEAVRHLSPTDQVDVFLALRQGLPFAPDADEEGIEDELTDGQKAELTRRLAEFRADPESAVSLEEFEAELRQRFGEDV